MNRYWIALALTALLTGCGATGKLMNGIMSSWEGAPLASVIQQWGLPDREYTVAGHHVYEWTYRKGYFPGTVTATGPNTAYTTPGAAGWCTRRLIVDDADFVTSWEWEGNNCPFLEAMEYKSWRR